jgi:hypothetical protein
MGAFDPSHSSERDAFVAKLDLAGRLICLPFMIGS